MPYQSYISITVHRKNLFQLICIIVMGITVTDLLSFNVQALNTEYTKNVFVCICA